MRKTIAIIGALDTKGDDFAFVKSAILARGHQPLVINTGIMQDPPYAPDVSASEVAKAGGRSLGSLRQEADRGTAVETMTKGIAILVKKLFDAGKIDAVLGMGGSAGTVIATSAMRALPIGIPKVMVSTLAAGDTAAYVGSKDIVLVPSVVDVAGVNRISGKIYANAVGAVIGMVETAEPDLPQKPLVAASMFGNTTQLVNQCQKILAKNGFETLVFHATGAGGRTMESLIEDGNFTAVLDLTTTELADELVGGVLSAGPDRMNAAVRQTLPQVIAPGCLDMVNFWGPESIPQKFNGRQFYHWNSNVTLMRTTPAENRQLGQMIAEKVNQSAAPVTIIFPHRGLSVLDSPEGEFWWPEADTAMFEAIKNHVNANIKIIELDCNINDAEFAQAASQEILAYLANDASLVVDNG